MNDMHGVYNLEIDLLRSPLLEGPENRLSGKTIVPGAEPDPYQQALDVTELLNRSHPLWEFVNVIITPHMAGSSPKLWERMADILMRTVERNEETGGFEDLENLVPT